jgi:ubiquinone biosynthesis monooxygenase Coq7
MRSLTPLDYFISHIDNSLKTLVTKAASAHRLSPAISVEELPLDDSEKEHAAGLMRINHTGEVCAQALYQGQSLTARLPGIREAMEEAAEEEIDHLVWCEQRIHQLNGRTSLLNPLFYGMSYSIGALAGALGDKWSLGFVAATEDQVCTHLESHFTELPKNDLKSRAILNTMFKDEQRHAEVAKEAGGIELPAPVKKLMTRMSKIMTKTAYQL